MTITNQSRCYESILRIRDKIAASKKKGLWMGGPVPLGYDVLDRKLVVNPSEAETVCRIFRLYLELGSVREVVAALTAQSLRTKVQQRTSGPHKGGVAFGRGGVRHLLKNRIYLGEIIHKGTSYPGEHDPIVPQTLWDAVQARMGARDRAGRRTPLQGSCSLLAGLIRDGLGRPMTPSHANKNGKRYRYYVTHEQHRTDRSKPAWRVPAHDLEKIVVDRLRDFLIDPGEVHRLSGLDDGEAIQACIGRAQAAADTLSEGRDADRQTYLNEMIERIDLHDDNIDIVLRLASINPDSLATHQLSIPVKRLRRGQEVRLVIAGSEPASSNRDDRLVALVAEAHAARTAVLEQTGSLAQIAERLGRCRGHLADMMRLSYLAPDIVMAILDGRQPASLKRKALMATSLSPDWCEQRKQLGFA